MAKPKKAVQRSKKPKAKKMGRPTLGDVRDSADPTERGAPSELMALRIPADDRKTVRAAAANAKEKETVYARRVLVERAKADLKKA